MNLCSAGSGWLGLMAGMLLAGAGVESLAGPAKFIDFSAVERPAGMGPLCQNWNAVGMDPDDNVYLVWGDAKGSLHKQENPGAYSDCALYRYDPTADKITLLGSLVETLKKAGNWHEGEFVEKGHTYLPCIDGKIYIGSMEFHSIEGSREFALREVAKYRGGHLFAYDIARGTLEDLTAKMPGGVITAPGQGLLALSAMPGSSLLVAQSAPNQEIIFYDTRRGEVTRRVPGHDELLGRLVGRETITTPSGKVFYQIADRENQPDGRGRFFVYDPASDKTTALPDIPHSVINGMAKTRDGRGIYAITQYGDLLRIDWEHDRADRLGELFSETERAAMKARGAGMAKVFGLIMSPDERTLFAFPFETRVLPPQEGRSRPGRARLPSGVFAFDLETRKSRKVVDFAPEFLATFCADRTGRLAGGFVTGSQLIDRRGRVYTAYQNGQDRVGLLQVDVSEWIDFKRAAEIARQNP